MVSDGKIRTRIRTGPKLSKIGRPKFLSSKTAPFGTKNLCRKEREKKKKKDEAPFPVKASPFENFFTLAPVV